MEPDEQDTLLVLAFLYLACGEDRRAVVLLALVERFAPTNPSVLRALSHAYTEVGHSDRALELLDRLEKAGNRDDRQGILLIRSRALMQLGRTDDARQCFQEFIASRGPVQAEAFAA